MKLQVWCTSYLNVPEREQLLLDMLASLEANGLKPEQIHLFLSSDREVKLELPPVNVYRATGRVKQFAGFSQIFQATRGRYQPTDWILFIDDDDLLLHLPPLAEGSEVILGTSLPYPAKAPEREDLARLQAEAKVATQGERDFSGTLARYEFVEAYFVAREKKTVHHLMPDLGLMLAAVHALPREDVSITEDCFFCSFLERYQTIVPPYMFFRNWTSDVPNHRASIAASLIKSA